MAEKNQLTENDAKAVEESFAAKLAMISSSTEGKVLHANPNAAAATPTDPKVDPKRSGRTRRARRQKHQSTSQR